MADDNRAISDSSPETQGALDLEITAIGKVNDALTALDTAVQQRVLRWAADKFGVALRKPSPTRDGSNGEHDDTPGGNADAGTYADFSSLFEAASPATDAERALVAGYWLQVIQSNADWDGFSANKELKNLGHGTDDITNKLKQLMDLKPQLVMQTRKAGTTRQAKKRYKVTGEGIKKVKQMISSAGALGNRDGGQD